MHAARRAHDLVGEDIRLACHLAEMAAQADPENKSVHEIRADIFQRRRDVETSLMAKGLFGYAANESKAKLGE